MKLSVTDGSLTVNKPAVFNSSLTIGGNNLQTQLNALAPKDNPTFGGLVTVNDDIRNWGKLSTPLKMLHLFALCYTLNLSLGGGVAPIFSRARSMDGECKRVAISTDFWSNTPKVRTYCYPFTFPVHLPSLLNIGAATTQAKIKR
jgi:hypothetical protein